jgi:hypothetical protein
METFERERRRVSAAKTKQIPSQPFHSFIHSRVSSAHLDARAMGKKDETPEQRAARKAKGTKGRSNARARE